LNAFLENIHFVELLSQTYRNCGAIFRLSKENLAEVVVFPLLR